MQVYRETAEALRAQNPNLDSDQLQSPEFKKAVLEQLVSQKLLEAEAEKLGISVSNSELSYSISQIPAFADKDGKFDMNLYQAFLQSRAMSAATFENDMRNSALIRKLQEYVTMPTSPLKLMPAHFSTLLLKKFRSITTMSPVLTLLKISRSVTNRLKISTKPTLINSLSRHALLLSTLPSLRKNCLSTSQLPLKKSRHTMKPTKKLSSRKLS